MKVYKVYIDTPWRSGETAEADKAADKAYVVELAQKYNMVKYFDYAQGYFLVADIDLPLLVSSVPLNSHSEVSIKKIELIFDSPDQMMTRLKTLLDRLEVNISKMPIPEASYNQHADAPISGPNLMSVNELCLLEDCCSDYLQEALSKGWRIIAVCPQEARRPDYVLGRVNEAAIQKYLSSARREID